MSRTHSPLALEDYLEEDSMDGGPHNVGRRPPGQPGRGEEQLEADLGGPAAMESTRLVIDVPPLCVDSAGSPLAAVGRPRAGVGRERRRRRALLLLVGACLVAAAAASVGVGVVVARKRSGGGAEWNPDFEDSAWSSTVAVADTDAALATFASPKDYYRTAFHFQPKKNWMNGTRGTSLCPELLQMVVPAAAACT